MLLAVAVVRGRTRSLVERFERRDRIPNNKDQTNSPLTTICETREIVHANDGQSNPSPHMTSENKEKIHISEDLKITLSTPATVCEADNSDLVMVKLLHYKLIEI